MYNTKADEKDIKLNVISWETLNKDPIPYKSPKI